MNELNTDYKSDIYYGVVIRGESLDGWFAPDVGMGRMKFIHHKYGEFKVNKGMSNDWMRECWEEFVEFISRFDTGEG